MAHKIVIKEEDIENANTYVPALQKETFVKTACENCLCRVEIAVEGDNKNQIPMPPFYKENPFMKARYMMGALVKFYLKKPYEPMEDGVLMAADEYDRWAASHIFGQLDRMKMKNAAVRDKIFDLQADYRDLEKRLNNEVYSLLQVQNDVGSRLMAMIFMQSTPESMMNAMQEMKELQKELVQYSGKKEEEKK